MLKSFLIIINIHIFAFASQIVLVVSQDSNTHKAKLQRYEDNKKIGKTIDVNIGKNGLGVGLSKLSKKIPSDKNEVLKKEGDKKAPLGIFKLSSVFGYSEHIDTNMPYIYASKDLICVDDSNSKFYNRIIKKPKSEPNSFELMRRDDDQYRLGVVVEHNKMQKHNRGSCIFLHVQKGEDKPTAGCTSMEYKDMYTIIKWLDIDKNPVLIQVPKKYLNDVRKLYPKLDITDLP